MIDLSKVEFKSVPDNPNALRAELKFNVEIEYKTVGSSKIGLLIEEAKMQLLFRIFEKFYGDIKEQFRIVHRHLLAHRIVKCDEFEEEFLKLDSMLKFHERYHNDFNLKFNSASLSENL